MIRLLAQGRNWLRTPLTLLPRAVAASMLLLAAMAGAARAQAAPDTTPDIEFIGLRRWTVQMIRDTMAVKAPGAPLGQCAVVLEAIGFPSASSAEFIRDGHRHIVVTLVEPADSARVRLRVERPDSSSDRPGWREVDSLFRARNPAFLTAVSLVDVHRAGNEAAERAALRPARGDSADVRRVWAFLDAHRSTRDLEEALWVLATDGNSANLAVAVALLGNFAEHEPAWWALMDAQRSSRGAVAATAIQVLRSMTQRHVPTVDWRPAAASIRALLAGTNVFAFAQTLDVLRTTHVSPGLAVELLGNGNGDLVLAHLGAAEPFLRETTRGFLVQVSGQDLGDDAAAWANWLAGLR
ncbi:MAG TPA: hypothetical protein VF092_16630 [Longimicrobium sp.]